MENFLLLLLMLSGIIVAAGAAAYFWAAIKEKRIVLNQNQWTLITWFVTHAVWAAEQAWRSDTIQKDERLKYAVKVVQGELIAHGIPSVPIEKIERMCAVMVNQEFNRARIVKPEPLQELAISSLEEIPTGLQQ